MIGRARAYYFVRNIKLDTFLEKRKRIIDKLARNTKTFIVNAPESSEFYELIKKNEAI